MGELYVLKGSPADIGKAYGSVLKHCFPEQVNAFINEGLAKHGWLDLSKLRIQAERLLASLPTHYLEEIEAFAEGVGLSLTRVAEWHAEYLARKGCSTVVAFPDGIGWTGHNTDYADFGAHQWGCTVVIEKPGRLPFMHFPLRGDLYAFQGVNRALLWVHTNWLPDLSTSVEGPCCWPYLFFVREVLEVCSNLDDVEKLLGCCARDSGLALTVIDGKSDEGAIFECTRSSHKRLPMENDVLLVTNHFRDGKSASESDSHHENSTRRLARLRSLVSKSCPASVADFTGILGDPNVEQAGAFSGTIQSVVACPGKQKIWLSQGCFPAASQGEFKEVAWPW